MPQALPVIGAVAGVAGTVAQVSAQRKAAGAQAEQERLNSLRSRRASVRELQILRATAIANANNFGAQAGSGIAGGLGSLSSRQGEASGFASQMSGLSRQITSLGTRADAFGGFASLAFKASDYFANKQQTQVTPIPNYTFGS
jgi:hypothetical protein